MLKVAEKFILSVIASTISFHNGIYFLIDGSGMQQVWREINKIQLLSHKIRSMELTACVIIWVLIWFWVAMADVQKAQPHIKFMSLKIPERIAPALQNSKCKPCVMEIFRIWHDYQFQPSSHEGRFPCKRTIYFKLNQD